MSLKNFRALAGLEVELGQTWPQIVQNGPQKLTLRRQGPKTELLGLENFRALAGLEVKLGQTRKLTLFLLKSHSLQNVVIVFYH